MLTVPASRIMPRTTLDLDPAVLRELRTRSRAEGKSMGQVASEVMARALTGPADAASPPFRWVSHDLGEPYVDLGDKEAVRAILDREE
jgi:hypothetical protein